MKKRLAVLMPYVAVLGADFYLLPFWARDTGSAMLLLLFVMPLIAFAAAAVYGARHGFSALLPLAALLLFAPTILLHYNVSAWVYAPAYALVVLVGVGIGTLLAPKAP